MLKQIICVVVLLKDTTSQKYFNNTYPFKKDSIDKLPCSVKFNSRLISAEQ